MPLKSPNQRVVNLWKVEDMLKDDVIKLDAVYQRDIVWQSAKMSMLIDSIMKRYYIPPLLFAVRTDENGKKIRVCIDGKQRLTSILRFIKNEIPFLDESTGIVEEVFFGSASHGISGGRNTTQNNIHRRYFTEEQRDDFYEAELIMMEFSDLDEDEELEIFARVQMGVSITAAEKLVATNSEVSKFCRDLIQGYEQLNSTIRQIQGSTFKWIAQLTYILHAKDDQFVATQNKLMDFLRDRTISLDESFKRSVRRTIRWLDALCQSEVGISAILYKNGMDGPKRRDVLRNIEFLVFGVYVNDLKNNIRVPELAADLTNMRLYFVQEYTRQLHTGNPCWQAGMVWLERMKAARRRTIPATAHVVSANGTRQGVVADSDASSADENDIESDDDENLGHQKKQRRQLLISASKRRRTAKNQVAADLKQEVQSTSTTHGHVNEHGRPLARRGGKKSSGVTRKS